MLAQKLCVAGLVIVHRKRERDQYARHTRSGKLSNSQRTGATNHQIGIRIMPGHFVHERFDIGLHARLLIGTLHRCKMLFAGLMQHVGANIFRQQGERLRQYFVDCLCTQTAAHYQHIQLAVARGIALLRIRQGGNIAAHRIAAPDCLRQHIGKSTQHFLRDVRQHLVAQSGDGILFMYHQRTAQQGRHHPARKSNIAAHTQHHVRTVAQYRGGALPQCKQQIERQHQHTQQALAAQPGKTHQRHFITMPGNQIGFHAARRAQPSHLPTLRTQQIGHGESGENMPAGSACHDEYRTTHTGRPRAMRLFS